MKVHELISLLAAHFEPDDAVKATNSNEEWAEDFVVKRGDNDFGRTVALLVGQRRANSIALSNVSEKPLAFVWHAELELDQPPTRWVEVVASTRDEAIEILKTHPEFRQHPVRQLRR